MRGVRRCAGLAIAVNQHSGRDCVDTRYAQWEAIYTELVLWYLAQVCEVFDHKDVRPSQKPIKLAVATILTKTQGIDPNGVDTHRREPLNNFK